jgi:hypothetical protein
MTLTARSVVPMVARTIGVCELRLDADRSSGPDGGGIESDPVLMAAEDAVADFT